MVFSGRRRRKGKYENLSKYHRKVFLIKHDKLCNYKVYRVFIYPNETCNFKNLPI